MVSRECFGKLAEVILEGGARQATKIFSPKEVVRATKQTFKRSSGRSPSVTILFTIGRPNYETRKFIKDCEKAGEPFPVKRLWLKFPKKRKR